jgi:RNA polymerase sigma factor (sigma-70 family)
MWGEMEQTPALAAPGSNDFGNSDNRLTGPIGGIDADKNQALSDDQFDLVFSYLPLAHSLARLYSGRGLSHEELCSGAEDGLIEAALRFDPDMGFKFGSLAKPYVLGGLRSLFKQKKICRLTTPIEPIPETQEAPLDPQSLDIDSLEHREQRIVVGRIEGKTLKEIGKELGISAERTRQVETDAHKKLRKRKGQVARACIRDLIKRRGYRKPTRELLPFKPVKYPGRALQAEEISDGEYSASSIESYQDRAFWEAHRKSCLYWMDRRASHYRFKNDGPPPYQRWPR